MDEPQVNRGRPALARSGEPPGASLRTPVPLLPQEVFEFVHELLRVEVVVTAWVRRLVPRRVIGPPQLPDLGLGRGVLGHRLVAARPKGPHGGIQRGDIEVQVEQAGHRGQQRLAHRRIRRPLEIVGGLAHEGQ